MAKHTGHTITSDSALGDAKLQRSLRFNPSDNPNLARTFGSSTNIRKRTLSLWVKRSKINDSLGQVFFEYSSGGSGGSIMFAGNGTGIGNNDEIHVSNRNATSGSGDYYLITNNFFRDPIAWYHIVLQYDTTQSTASDRIKLYVNGSQASFSSASYPSQNYDSTAFLAGTAAAHNIGYGFATGSANYFGGYLAEIHFLDGYAYDASYFGFTDPVTGIWMPRRYEGVYGNNGFYLDFSDNSSTTTLGIDKSLNGNDFTPNNFSVSAGDGNDSVTDTPTFTKATLNAITGWTNNATLKNGNLEMTGSDGFKEISTIAVDGTSKFYYEVVNTSAAGWQLVGVFVGQPNNPSNALSNSEIWGFASTQATYFGGSYTSTSDVPSWTNNDVMGIKYENGSLKLYKNGTLQTANTSSVPTNDIVFAYIANDNTSAAAFVRFNSDSWTQSTAAGVDDSWELSIKNLPPNVPSIIRPQKHFEPLIYTGDGTAIRSISGLEFKPDLVWIKNRSQTDWHIWSDVVRGFDGKTLYSNRTEAEYDASGSGEHGYISAVHDHGFVVTDDDGSVGGNCNANSENYVAWCWKAGGAAVTNTEGTITSQVSANTEAGFSIVSFTGNATSGATVGHGLNAKPKWFIIKERGNANDWVVYHESLGNSSGNTNVQFLNLTNDIGGGFAGGYNNTAPTSSVFSLGNSTETNRSSGNFIAFCWAEVPGFSKFGKYTGNGSSDGVYVDLGFRPAWLMVKNFTTAYSWDMFDNKRDPDNVCTQVLASNLNDAEATTATCVDFLSNGFKFRNSHNSQNRNGDTFIYMAFAEQPGTTSFDTFPNAR